MARARVEEGVYLKFAQNAPLARFLLPPPPPTTNLDACDFDCGFAGAACGCDGGSLEEVREFSQAIDAYLSVTQEQLQDHFYNHFEKF